MKRLALLFAFLSAASVFPLLGQRKVQMENMYERLYVVVPIVGSGTVADPWRPMYVPVSPDRPETGLAGIIGFVSVESDDGTHALVELVARDRAVFQPILEDRNPSVKVFHKGKDKKDDVEREFRRYKRDFNLDALVVNIP